MTSSSTIAENLIHFSISFMEKNKKIFHRIAHVSTRIKFHYFFSIYEYFQLERKARIGTNTLLLLAKEQEQKVGYNEILTLKNFIIKKKM